MAMMDSVREGIRNPRKALQVVGHRLLSTVGSHRYQRFIVLSRSRTGSNLLVAFLNSHPQIKADGEIFASLDGRDYRDVLRRTFSRQPYYVKAKGFKIFYNHPHDGPDCGLWEHLQAMEGLCVIHLKRRNILRTLLSRRVAGQQDVWAVTSDRASARTGEPVPVSFTVEELDAKFRKVRARIEAGDHAFRNHRLLSLDYEDLADGSGTGFRKVTDLLGLAYAPPKAALRKQGRTSLRESIANYDEMKSAFAGTEWESFFED